MSDHNDNDEDDFVDDVLNVDDDDDNEDDDRHDVLTYHMALMMMMMTTSMSMMTMHVTILLDTAGLEILELIISNGGCEVFTIQIFLAIGFYID